MERTAGNNPHLTDAENVSIRLTILERLMSTHEGWWRDFRFAELGKREREALPKMIEAYLNGLVVADEDERRARRRIAWMIAASSASTAFFTALALLPLILLHH